MHAVCPQCGRQYKIKRITKVYCSPLCRQNAHNAKQRAALKQPVVQETSESQVL
jgi:hypothetical protein